MSTGNLNKKKGGGDLPKNQEVQMLVKVEKKRFFKINFKRILCTVQFSLFH